MKNIRYIGMVVGILLLTATIVQGTKLEIRGTPAAAYSAVGILNTGNITDNPGTTQVKWTSYSFPGFFYDIKYDLGRETLAIVNAQGTILTNTSRQIKEQDLIYNTQGQGKTLNIVNNGFNNNYSAAKAAGLEMFDAIPPFKNGQFMVVGWQGGKYVGLNGKMDKLTKLLIENGSAISEIKTLAAGDVWNMGEGWKLAVESIDEKTNPRQASLSLTKNGVKMDEMVLQQSRVYTYYDKSIANESNVPLFATLVDSIFSANSSDMVQLRYTWLLSGNVTTLNIDDQFGIFKVVNIDEDNKQIVMDNKDATVDLNRNTEQPLMGNLKFKIADSSTLRFYPKVDYDVLDTSSTSNMPSVTVTVTATPAVTASQTATVIETETPIIKATVKPVEVPIQKSPGFDSIILMMAFISLCILGRR